MRTFEFVSPKHPDKLCDQIADSLLDAYLEQDSYSRVAIEVMGGHGKITLNGEVTSKAKVDMKQVALDVIGKGYKVDSYIGKQSPEIARGVDVGGAGDQGIMVGYATNETDTYMPKGYELARKLCKNVYREYPYDGKTQITLDRDDVVAVVASFQNSKSRELETLVRDLIKSKEYFINPAGEWKIGGFDADSGLSGRKIVIDNYGPYVPVGGGSFSGKDPSKVDRSGAYMARKIAVDLLKRRNAKEVFVHLGYVIGVINPVMAIANIDGKEEEITEYDLTPNGIIESLGLRNPIYKDLSMWGHFN